MAIASRSNHHALPYAATVIVLVFISRDRRLLQLNLPASLGKSFVLLTLIGGGVFGNPPWAIWDAIRFALRWPNYV